LTYATAQAGVAAVIAKLSGYDVTTNVRENDYRALDSGENAVVLRRGTSTHEDLTFHGTNRTVLNKHRVKAEIWIPLRIDHKTQRDTMVSVYDTLRTQILKWPKLDAVSGVTNSSVSEVSEPEEFTFGKGRSKRWWRAVINVDVEEITETALSE
jgi:hypothetical protein